MRSNQCPVSIDLGAQTLFCARHPVNRPARLALRVWPAICTRRLPRKPLRETTFVTDRDFSLNALQDFEDCYVRSTRWKLNLPLSRLTKGLWSSADEKSSRTLCGREFDSSQVRIGLQDACTHPGFESDALYASSQMCAFLRQDSCSMPHKVS